MATRRIYLENQYARECDSLVLKIVESKGKRAYMVLDQTVFHPLGGGQPSDVGEIRAGGGVFAVKKVITIDGELYHYGVFQAGLIGEGSPVHCRIDWEARYKVMRLHTAGHVLDRAVSLFYGGLVNTVSAFHGPPQAYIEYAVEEKPVLEAVERIANEIVARGLPVIVKWVSGSELASTLYNAPNTDRVPSSDKYRVVEIPTVNAMPCMGTHVSNTMEVGRILLTGAEETAAGWKLFYTVA